MVVVHGGDDGQCVHFGAKSLVPSLCLLWLAGSDAVLAEDFMEGVRKCWGTIKSLTVCGPNCIIGRIIGQVKGGEDPFLFFSTCLLTNTFISNDNFEEIVMKLIANSTVGVVDTVAATVGIVNTAGAANTVGTVNTITTTNTTNTTNNTTITTDTTNTTNNNNSLLEEIITNLHCVERKHVQIKSIQSKLYELFPSLLMESKRSPPHPPTLPLLSSAFNPLLKLPPPGGY